MKPIAFSAIEQRPTRGIPRIVRWRGWLSALALSTGVLASCSEPTSTTQLSGVLNPQVAESKSTTLYGDHHFGELTSAGYKGVPMYSNYYRFRSGGVVSTGMQSYVDASGNVRYSLTPISGWKHTGTAFECPEYVIRFTWLKYGKALPNVSGGAYWSYSASEMFVKRKVSNGSSTVLPTNDDIVVFGNTSGGAPVSGDGHVAIGANVSSSSIVYAQQNTQSPMSQKGITTVRLAGSNRYKLDPIGSNDPTKGYVVKGWFTRATHPASKPAITGFGPTNLRVSTSRVTLALITTGIVNLDDVTIKLRDPKGFTTSFSYSAGSVRATPAGVVFDAKLTVAGSWTVTLAAGGSATATYQFPVK